MGVRDGRLMYRVGEHVRCFVDDECPGTRRQHGLAELNNDKVGLVLAIDYSQVANDHIFRVGFDYGWNYFRADELELEAR